MISSVVNKKKSIIITGANSGIGFECVKQFCEYYTDKIQIPSQIPIRLVVEVLPKKLPLNF